MKMGRVTPPCSDVQSTLGYFARSGYILPTYMFTPPHRQHGFLFKTVASEHAQDLQDLLRTNLLFNWLLGDYGPIDDFTISRGDVEDVFEEIVGYPVDTRLIPTRIIVGKELKFWDHILNGEARRRPLKIKEDFKYPVMIESLDQKISNK
jgi:hypothetical protein